AETQEEGSVGARDFKGKDVFVPWHLQKKLDLRPSENIPSESNGSRKKECNGGEHGSVGDSFGRGDAEGKDSAHQSNCNGQSTHSRLGRVAEAVKSVKGEDGISDEKELTVPTRNRQAADETEGHVSQRDSERTARRHDARSPPGTVALENLLEPGAIADGRAQGLKDIGTSSGRDSQYFGNHDLVGKDAQVSGREEKSDTNSLSHKGNPDSVSSDQQSKDCMEPKDDESGITTLFRYYHVFSKEEILGLCRQVDGLEVVECYFDANNWGVILRKT
ncbi:methyltransferase domain-containing protein, partial [Cystoisospora suis]